MWPRNLGAAFEGLSRWASGRAELEILGYWTELLILMEGHDRVTGQDRKGPLLKKVTPQGSRPCGVTWDAFPKQWLSKLLRTSAFTRAAGGLTCQLQVDNCQWGLGRVPNQGAAAAAAGSWLASAPLLTVTWIGLYGYLSPSLTEQGCSWRANLPTSSSESSSS